MEHFFQLVQSHSVGALTVLVTVVHLIGILSAIDALYWVRSSQGAIAWGLSLIMLPWVALPLYWIFGRQRFAGYREAIRRYLLANRSQLLELQEKFRAYHAPSVPLEPECERALELIAGSEFTGDNDVQLLVDGDPTFRAIFDAIHSSQRTVLVQFYIVRGDQLGQELKDALLAAAQRGVRCYFLYDEVGSSGLANQFLNDLHAGGVHTAPFGTRQGRGNYFQLNFRNHRKIVIVDGTIAFVGGHNIGDEYRGISRQFGAWRDTHVAIRGPAVIPIQRTFLADWYWATQKGAEVDWPPPAQAGAMRVLPLPSGPADERERFTLAVLEAIRSAKKRLWIASPYFVPDDAVIVSLQLAALRGVDVRLLLPEKPDHILVWLAAHSFMEDVRAFGVKVFRYQAGFLHQKVFLVDDTLAAVGTGNLDNRSFRLNFEITILVADRDFNNAVAQMLSADFERSRAQQPREFDRWPLVHRLASRLARLFAPVL